MFHWIVIKENKMREIKYNSSIKEWTKKLKPITQNVKGIHCNHPIMTCS